MLPINWEFPGGIFGSQYGILRIQRDVDGKDFGFTKYQRRASKIP
jgi:hypothetical protein